MPNKVDRLIAMIIDNPEDSKVRTEPISNLKFSGSFSHQSVGICGCHVRFYQEAVSSLYLRQPGLRDQRFHLALGPYGSVY